MATDNIVDKLHFLAERCNDGAKGYSQAGNQVADSQLRLWLFAKAEQREGFAKALNKLLVDLGGATDRDGSFLGGLHREWLDFKANITTDSAEEVLEECIRGEEKAAADYRHIINEHSLPPEAEALAREQLAAIQASRTELERKEEMLGLS